MNTQNIYVLSPEEKEGNIAFIGPSECFTE